MYQYAGDDLAKVLLLFHVITGCDITFKFRKGKIYFLRKLLRNKLLCQYLQNLGQETELSNHVLRNALKVVQCFIYSANPNKTYLESRVRIYKNLERKSSQLLPPDEKSAIEDIKRCHLAILIMKHCIDPYVPYYDPERYRWSWTFDNNIKYYRPIWYRGFQLPPKQSESNSLLSDPMLKPC